MASFWDVPHIFVYSYTLHLLLPARHTHVREKHAVYRGRTHDGDDPERSRGQSSALNIDLGRRAEAFCLLRISDPNHATSVVVLISKAEPELLSLDTRAFCVEGERTGGQGRWSRH